MSFLAAYSETICVLLLVGSITNFLLVFLLYPAAVWLRSLRNENVETPEPDGRPSISLIVVARNAEDLIEAKIDNCMALDVPPELLELIFFSDGSTDGTERALQHHPASARLRILSSTEHVGKAEALNQCVEVGRGDLLVFSDVDARLQPLSVTRLVRHFQTPRTGGVCGRRMILPDSPDTRSAQETYSNLDTLIKTFESRSGNSITSNDGKLYAIRRELFRPVPGAVTDDLYAALAIVAQGYRFTFEPEAIAYVRVPSRSLLHEVRRRRRIVSRSLLGIFLMGRLLNPLRFGSFAIGLAINKVLRRLMPFALLGILVATVYLSLHHEAARIFLLLQLCFFAVALAYPTVFRTLAPESRAAKISALACYFCAGNLGTLLGVCDFLTGRRVTRWDPLKSD